MNIKRDKLNYSNLKESLIFLYGNEISARALPFRKEELAYVQQRREADVAALVVLNHLPHKIYVQCFDPELPATESLEKLRRAAADIQQLLVKEGEQRVSISGGGMLPEEMFAFLEGLHMANYRFDRYRSKKEKLLTDVVVDECIVEQQALEENLRLWRRIDCCREWVNEPVMVLNAARFAELLGEEAERTGVKCTVLGQRKLQSLKMGGILAVNRGSEDEARLVVLEYKPTTRINRHPVALVGKGVMYDTGGLSIKTGDYMTTMKSDMAGAAMMAGALLAAAENGLPIHLIAVLPLTDNRPGRNAYAPDDILRMYDGTTVEITNSDAEGRLILADAIAYADEQEPELIIDAATLTGAAVRALGTSVAAAMQQDAEGPLALLRIVGNQVHERLWELPLWKEYDELLKSEVADMVNCNLQSYAGTITAGRFLAHFAHHPFIHLDIAGTAFYTKREHYFGVGASGFGIRLLYAFFQTYDALNK